MTSSSRVTIRWSGKELIFKGRGASDGEIVIDGDSGDGPSPPETLLLSLASCMAVDLKMILEKSRVPVEDVRATVHGDRAEESPRRYTRVQIRFELSGPADEDRAKVKRALQLSRDKYCSVLHTLRSDLVLELETEVLKA